MEEKRPTKARIMAARSKRSRKPQAANAAGSKETTSAAEEVLASMWKSAAATSGDSKRTSAQVSKKSTESKKELSAKDKALIIREKEKLEAARYLFGPENENDDEKTHRANMKKFHSILAQERKERLQGGKEATSMDDFASLFDDLAIRSSDEYESFPRLFAKAGAMFEKYGWEADNAYVMDAAESIVLEDFKPSDSDELRFPFDKISKIALAIQSKSRKQTINRSLSTSCWSRASMSNRVFLRTPNWISV